MKWAQAAVLVMLSGSVAFADVGGGEPGPDRGCDGAPDRRAHQAGPRRVSRVALISGGQQGISFTSQAIPLKVER